MIEFSVRPAYPLAMFTRTLTMLVVLAITVATTVASAHAARMSMNPGADHVVHVAGMLHATDAADSPCDARQPCGPADAEMCKLVCAGLLVFLTPQEAPAAQVHRSVSHDIRAEAIPHGRAPGGNERPPKLRLL